MTWYGSVVYFCWPVGNHHYRVNKPLAGAARATRSTLGVTATQCSSDFFFQLAFSLEIQRLINRFRRECPILCVRRLGLQVIRESVGVSHG